MLDWTFFEGLTPAQAEVLSAAITLASAFVVAIVAPLTFHLLTRRGVKSFEQSVETLQQSARRAEDQSAGISHAIRSIYDHVEELGVLLSSLQEGVANTQNTLVESASEGPRLPNGGQESNREKIKALWRALQDVAERAASDPQINGNTRAKYARVDRRGYLNLVTMLINEGQLAFTGDQWKEAYFLWNAARYASAPIPDADVSRMQNLVEAIKGAQGAYAASKQSIQAALRRPPPRQEFRGPRSGNGEVESPRPQ